MYLSISAVHVCASSRNRGPSRLLTRSASFIASLKSRVPIDTRSCFPPVTGVHRSHHVCFPFC